MKKIHTIFMVTLLSFGTSQMTFTNSYDFFLARQDVKIALTVRKELHENLMQVKHVLTTASTDLRVEHVQYCLELLYQNASMLDEHRSTIINFLEVRPKFNQDFSTAQQQTMNLTEMLHQALQPTETN